MSGLFLWLSMLAPIEAEHPSDLARVLEAGDPELWEEAVLGLLGKEDEIDYLAISSVVRRLPHLSAGTKRRVARALASSFRHPRSVEALVELSRAEDPALRKESTELLLSLRTTEALDALRDLILAGGPERIEALRALVAIAEVHPEVDFDRELLPAAATLLRSAEPEDREAALAITSRLDTPALREEWALLLRDGNDEIRTKAHWRLAEVSDPRPCPELFRKAKADRRRETTRSAGSYCAPKHFLDYVAWYQDAEDPSDRELYREMIEGATDLGLLEHPEILEGLRSLSSSSDAFLAETASEVLEWERKALEERERGAGGRGLSPWLLGAVAFVSGGVGFLLFVLAFRLWVLAVRVRNRPLSKASSLALGPVALEGEARPAGAALKHPVTGETTLYFAGAGRSHPRARFYLEDDSGRVLVDPRRAVLFSEDDVIVEGERLHVVGFAERERDGTVVVTKDPGAPPLYRSTLHRLLEMVFGLGLETAVTKMLFTDPSRCFWIWDDLEKRPMGEARDLLWLGGSVLLGGAWMVVFAVAALGMVDREVAAEIARAIDAAPR